MFVNSGKLHCFRGCVLRCRVVGQCCRRISHIFHTVYIPTTCSESVPLTSVSGGGSGAAG